MMFSFGTFHTDAIPTSLVAVSCPVMVGEWVTFVNHPDSTGNVLLGSERLGVVGNGVVLRPGETTGWIPVQSLNLVWHKETDATTYLLYGIIGHHIEIPAVLLQEIDRYPLLLENGQRIRL